MTRSVRAWGLAIVVTALAVTTLAAPAARAETAYRYWGYWLVVDDAWTFAQEGPATRLPVDGSVEGWRFAISTAAGSADAAPRVDAATVFDQACGDTPQQAGRMRVAVHLDFGTPQDAPGGGTPPAARTTCVVVDEGATAAAVLAAAADVRAENGLVCGIAGYPATGCADIVDTSAMDAAPAGEQATPADGGSAGLGGPVATGLVVIVLAAVGLVLWRRR